MGKKLDLRDYFSMAAVINMDKDLEERWPKFEKKAEAAGITGYERYRGVEGDLAQPPMFWRSGKGAWGCLMSHAGIAQKALLDKVELPVLFMEDDVMFTKDFAERLPLILEEVRGNYDMLYLGGQHLTHNGKPWRERYQKEVICACNVNRTHAFIVHPRFLLKFYQHILYFPDYPWMGKPWHIDHQLGNLHDPNSGGGGGRFRILAAQPWICGQDEGDSKISAKKEPRRWFRYAEKDVNKED